MSTLSRAYELGFRRSLKEYVKVLSEKFPTQQLGLVAFFQEVESCFNELYNKRQGRKSGNRSKIDNWNNVPFLTMIDNYVNDDRLKKILSILSQYTTDNPGGLSTLIAIPYFGYYIEGGSYPVGGTQVLSNSLAASIRKDGGEVRLKTPITDILVENGEVKGVCAHRGETFHAKAVISNADVRRTFLELVKREHLPSYFLERIEKIRPATSAFIISLGVDFVPDINPATFVSEDNEVIALMVPSKIDPSLAPPGHACVTLMKLVPYDEAISWERSDPHYLKRKEHIGDNLIRLAEIAIPNLRQHIIFREDASPSTFARYAWTTGGSIYGLAIDEWKPSMKTPIKGLYLAGANTASRPGVEDAVFTGIMAANKIEGSLMIKPMSIAVNGPHSVRGV